MVLIRNICIITEFYQNKESYVLIGFLSMSVLIIKG